MTKFFYLILKFSDVVWIVKKIKNGKYKTDFIFLFAWNEWAEGGYLEPDESRKYGFLESIKNNTV